MREWIKYNRKKTTKNLFTKIAFVLTIVISITCVYSAYAKYLNKKKTPSIYELKSAIYKNNYKKVKRLISKGADLHAVDENDETPLIIACKEQATDDRILNILIENGSNIFYESQKTYKAPILSLLDGKKYDVIEKTIPNLPSLEKRKFVDYYLLRSIVWDKNVRMIKTVFPFFLDTLKNTISDFELLQYAMEQYEDKQYSYDNQIKRKGSCSFTAEKEIEVMETLLGMGIEINNPHPEHSIFPFATDSPVTLRYILDKGFDVHKKIMYHEKQIYLMEFYVRRMLTRSVITSSIRGVLDDITQEEIMEAFDVWELYIEKGMETPKSYSTPYDYLIMKIITHGDIHFLEGFFSREMHKKLIDYNKESLEKLAIEKVNEDFAERIVQHWNK